MTTVDSLRRWNQVLAALHGAQAIAILILATAKSFPVTASYLQIDRLASGSGSPALVPVMQQIGDIRLAYVVAGFFALSAVAHATMAYWGRKRYEADLANGINRFRWFEYAASASLMLIGIAVLAGVTDLALLICIFALSAIMNLCGLLMELYNARRKASQPVRWGAYWLGCLAGIVPWIAILIYLISSQTLGAGVPGFVWVIFGSLFVFFNGFAINMVLQYRKIGPWKDYLYGEKSYMILSLVAKTALAWQVFAGSLRP